MRKCWIGRAESLQLAAATRVVAAQRPVDPAAAMRALAVVAILAVPTRVAV